MPQWLVIGISGVTCGGKTTLSYNLREYFQSKQNQRIWQTPYTIGDVQVISQDDYFLPVDDLRHKWNEKLNAINFELITSLDMKQMLSDITWTMRGRYLVNGPMDNVDFIDEMNMTTSTTNYEQYNASGALMMPLMPPPAQMLSYHNIKLHQQQQQQQQQQQPPFYYYQNQQQHPSPPQQPHHQHQMAHHQQHHNQQQQRHSLRLANANNAAANKKQRDAKINILIIDGFMIFNQAELLTLCNLKFHFHLPYEKCYERRRQRVYEPPDVTGYFEMCVWPYYEKNFADFRERKDVIFLNGEIGKERIRDFVLRKIARYVEKRCDVAFMVHSSSLSSLLPASSPSQSQSHSQLPHCLPMQSSSHKGSAGGIPNGNHNGSHVLVVNPCPMEQQ